LLGLMSRMRSGSWSGAFCRFAAIGGLPRTLPAQFNGAVYHFHTGSQWRDRITVPCGLTSTETPVPRNGITASRWPRQCPWVRHSA